MCVVWEFKKIPKGRKSSNAELEERDENDEDAVKRVTERVAIEIMYNCRLD